MVVILGELGVTVSKFMKKLIIIPILLSLFLYSHNLSAERLQGPGLIQMILEPGDRKYYKISLKPDRIARFIGHGKGGYVDYFVYDPNGVLIADDTNPGSDCDIEFTPKLPSYYYFMAKNYGKTSSDIVVRTN